MTENNQNDEQAIRAVIALWLDASKRGDLDTVLNLMTDDAVFMVPGMEPFGKDAFAARSKNMQGIKIDGTSEIVELQILGDWAWLRNKLHITVTAPSGTPVVNSGYVLTILSKNKGGKWQLARDANLLTPETQN
jgi:uncharacterized protein (TIGR02246 family)